MEFSGLEAQVFIGVAVILGCAFVALLCDYLKGVNERLRERTLELTVRVEESGRWSQILQTVQAAASAPVASAPVETRSHDAVLMNEINRLHHEMEQMARSVASLAELRHATDGPRPVVEQTQHEAPSEQMAAMAAVHQVMEPVAAKMHDIQIDAPAPIQSTFAADPFVSHTPIPDRSLVAEQAFADPAPVRQSVASFISGLKIPAREAARDLTATPFIERVSIPSGPEVEVIHDVPAPHDRDAAEPARPEAMKIRVMRTELPSRPVDIAPHAAPEPAPPPVVTPPAAVEPEPVQEPAVEESMVEPLLPTGTGQDLALPSGMHDRATLEFLRNDTAPFSGLVVAIGINDYERLEANAGAEAAQDLVRSVSQLVKSLTSNLVGPQHFACRSADDEFVIAFNGEIGPAAQRRMSAVSERLWDFQLRSIGTFSVVFSWGATEANEESFAEAIDAACERMRETRNNRKSMGGEKARKRVVA